ncbi:MAG: selenium-dependent molybdenum cofactor biosynthesis protein YqeB [Anaerolineae bacterium]
MPGWPFSHIRVAVRGGGDLGSGVAYRLHRAGFPVLITELEAPLLVRRAVSFGSAAVQGMITVDGVTARRVSHPGEVSLLQQQGEVPVICDPDGELLQEYAPVVLVDARMLKADPGVQPVQALLTIGLGPGFEAPLNCDVAVETNRGHNLGRVIWHGSPEPDTRLPGAMKGIVEKRVLRAPTAGLVKGLAPIGSRLAEGDPVAAINGEIITAPFEGVLRGLIHENVPVRPGMKIGDLDPRAEPAYCFTISEKSLAIGGGVLEAILSSPAIRALVQGST